MTRPSLDPSGSPAGGSTTAPTARSGRLRVWRLVVGCVRFDTVAVVRDSLQATLSALAYHGLVLDAPVYAYLASDGSLHAWLGCSQLGPRGAVGPREVTLEWWFSHSPDSPGSACDCGGWKSTSVGSLFLDLIDLVDVLDELAAKTVPRSWARVSRWVAAGCVAREACGMWADELDELSDGVREFAARATAAIDAGVADAFRLLPHRPLFESVAAQALELPMRPATAPLFAAWAAEMFSLSFVVPTAVSARNQVAPPSEPVSFDRASRRSTAPAFPLSFAASLDDAFNAGRMERWVVFSRTDAYRRLASGRPEGAVLALLAQHPGATQHAGLVALPLPGCVAAGVEALVGLSSWVACVQSEPSWQVLDVAAALWEQSPGLWSSSDLRSLSSALEVASALA